jgi:UDP-N-acetylmuramate: L-alanyl-gamma-D-glutamyl-meso-diaminopimelate ligase
VVEADEYDTAFFDKRSKFVHYRPRTLILNNLEFDHADIFTDLAAIQTQFHHLVRTVPGNGLIIRKAADTALDEVLERGCWTPVVEVSDEDGGVTWASKALEADGSRFEVILDGQVCGIVGWGQLGRHNLQNALAALAAAHHAGVTVEAGIAALCEFQGIKRRLEVRGTVNGVTVYDDFAHHPTAIASTLQGLRKRVGDARILVLLEPRSNTMKMGVHRDTLAASLEGADRVWIHEPPDLGWSITDSLPKGNDQIAVMQSVEQIVADVVPQTRPGDHLLVMSNGGFGGIHEKLLMALQQNQ